MRALHASPVEREVRSFLLCQTVPGVLGENHPFLSAFCYDLAFPDAGTTGFLSKGSALSMTILHHR